MTFMNDGRDFFRIVRLLCYILLICFYAIGRWIAEGLKWMSGLDIARERAGPKYPAPLV